MKNLKTMRLAYKNSLSQHGIILSRQITLNCEEPANEINRCFTHRDCRIMETVMHGTLDIRLHIQIKYSAITTSSSVLITYYYMLPASGWAVQEIQGLSEEHNDSVWYHTLWTGNTRDGQNWLAFHMQVSCKRVRSTTHSGVGGQTGFAQIWSTIHQQLRVPDLPSDVSLTDWDSCP